MAGQVVAGAALPIVLDPGWAALLGALVGGAGTLLGALTTGRLTAQVDARKQQALVAATALLLQDDFWHYQATLARALDGRCWWHPDQLLDQQATIDDRKTVWAALKTQDTWTVANAQGWMDYLRQRRKVIGGDSPPLQDPDLGALRTTFEMLDCGRFALADLADRPASSFRESTVLKLLRNPSVLDGLVHDSRCREPVR